VADHEPRDSLSWCGTQVLAVKDYWCFERKVMEAEKVKVDPQGAAWRLAGRLSVN